VNAIKRHNNIRPVAPGEIAVMSASVPHLLDTVFPESPVERRAPERQGPDSRENLNANTVKELQDLEMGEEDQNATLPYDHKLITS
jgi:hypothetical protein